jgi:hypothetical protein
MAEERSNYMELLKYPITVFSILLALIIAKYTLGISFGPISEVGPGGVKFSQETNAKLADLEGKLNGVLVEIDALRKTASLEDTTKRPQIEAEIFEATQTVSDQTAQLASLSTVKQTSGTSQRGFLWIGDYSNKWDRARLGSLDTGQPITLPPDKLQPGTEYKVLGNMVVRDGLPPNDQDYFRSREIVGTITRVLPI